MDADIEYRFRAIESHPSRPAVAVGAVLDDGPVGLVRPQSDEDSAPGRDKRSTENSLPGSETTARAPYGTVSDGKGFSLFRTWPTSEHACAAFRSFRDSD